MDKRFGGAALSSSFWLLLFILLLLLHSSSGRRTLQWAAAQAQQQRTWCVAKPSAGEVALMEDIDFACSQVSCAAVQKGGPCFEPDGLASHASVAMNLYYQSRGRKYWNCHFNGSALITITDPSYGSCVYEYV